MTHAPSMKPQRLAAEDANARRIALQALIVIVVSFSAGVLGAWLAGGGW